jgi:hypothetical protein
MKEPTTRLERALDELVRSAPDPDDFGDDEYREAYEEALLLSAELWGIDVQELLARVEA